MMSLYCNNSQSMPNPFINPITQNKKGRPRRQGQQPQQQQPQQQQQQPQQQQPQQQDRQQKNPFLNNSNSSNSNSNSTSYSNSYSNSFSQGVQPRGNSFSEQKCIQAPVPTPSFEESFPSLSQSHDQSQSQGQGQIPVPKLNFKSAIQGNQGHSQPIQGHPTTRLSNPIQCQNQFLRPTNQFLHSITPVNHIHYHRDHNENECNEDLNNDAYDSAYTKYYDD